MHGTNLVRGQRFAKEINCAHLSTEYTLLVQFRSGTDITFVKWLEMVEKRKKKVKD